MFDGHGLDLGESPAKVGRAELRARQVEICSQLESGSILLIVNNPESIRSADVEYPYRSNSNMLYLVGWEAPEAVACFHQTDGKWQTRLYVPPRNVEKETWTGIRPGLEGAGRGDDEMMRGGATERRWRGEESGEGRSS